jgi:hypothetical protein
MPNRSRDAAFAAFVSQQRETLLGVAYLMSASTEEAGRILSASLADVYRGWSNGADAVEAALRLVVTGGPRRLSPSGERFELIDTPADRVPASEDIVDRLAMLSAQDRRVVVLGCFAGLSAPRIAALLGTDADQVAARSQAALDQLAHLDPIHSRLENTDDLARRLADAVPAQLLAGPAARPEAALATGRRLARRRGGALMAAAATVVAALLGVGLLAPARSSRDLAADSPAPRRPVAATTCDLARPDCQGGVARGWRAQMARVAGSYLDPEGSYFSGYTYSYDELYDSPGFWLGRGGVLGFDMFRLNDGATEVYVQIATAAQFAVPCGQRTRQSCATMQLPDGTTFLRTATNPASGAMEVQFSPHGEQVITVVARRTSRGKNLQITRSQLIALVQDPRLRLPRV